MIHLFGFGICLDQNENLAEVEDGGIYGNVPRMELSTIEMHLNSQNDTVDALASSSFDHKLSDDTEYGKRKFKHSSFNVCLFDVCLFNVCLFNYK